MAFRRRRSAAGVAFATGVLPVLLWSAGAEAQQSDLTALREQVARSSPVVAAARAELDAARGRERQAGAFPNPTLTYAREQTSPASQDVAALEQRIEVGGQRGARAAAARLRREAAEARLAAAEAEVDVEVARRVAAVNAARRRAEVATAAAEQFVLASRVTERRLAEGDVSGYEARRIRLESARYAALAAEAQLAERRAALQLAELFGSAVHAPPGVPLLEAVHADLLDLAPDSLAALAAARNAAVRAAALEAAAAREDASLARRQRIPSPAMSAGYLRQRVDDVTHTGFVAGITLPLPLWDRGGAAVDAAEAEARLAGARLQVMQLRLARELLAAVDAVRQADTQVSALRSSLGLEAVAALKAAETAYAEGEITLVEWLDAVRAYQEAEAAFAAVLAESFTQRAALEQLLGVTLLR